jgi:PPK2 family polyphosphate:nucleotide phosphotransferase
MKKQPLLVETEIKLKHVDAACDGGLEKEPTKQKTDMLCARIDELQQLLYANASHSVLLLFQGMDASGKDGSTRSVLRHVNPTGIEVANFKVPSTEERAHDYLWRVHKVVPRFGNIGVFNRSHYEGVLAERILKIVPKKVWRRRYEEIVNFETMLVENNVIVLKFYLHISKEEQRQRFEERLSNPRKNWKFSHADLETRQHWDDYICAYEDMLNATSHKRARWHVIPADRNWYRDYLIARTVTDAMERLKMRWPEPAEDFSKIKVK